MPDDSKQAGGLEVDQDAGFQRRDWRVQRIGRAVFVLVVIAALLGAFGGGWLSNARTRSGDGRLTLDYQRIVRRQARSHLEFEVRSIAPGDTLVELWIARDFLGAMLVRSVTPEPALVRISADRLIYRLALGEGTDRARITIVAEPTGGGRLAGDAGIVGGPSIRIRQLVLP